MAVYSNSFNVPFQFDDSINIENNPAVAVDSFSDLSVSKILEEHSGKRIISQLSFAINHIFAGSNVLPYHVTNIIIHIVNAFLLFLLLSLTMNLVKRRNQQGISKAIPFMAATAWLLHPINTQSVIYVVQRMAALGAFFYLTAFLFYYKARVSQLNISGSKTVSYIFYFLTFFSYICALLCKENVVLLPIMIVIYEWYFFRNLSREFLIKALTFLGLACVLILVSAYVYFDANPFFKVLGYYRYREFTLDQRLLTQLRVVPFYLSLLVLPLPARLNLESSFCSIKLTF